VIDLDRYWTDEATPWPPRVLVISTEGIEIESLMFFDPGENIHWLQAWKPIPCSCRAVHRPCDASEFVLVVGRHDRQIHFHPNALVAFVLPSRLRSLPPGGGQVVWDHDTNNFGPWAADVVLNLVAPLSTPVRFTYGLHEMKRLLGFADVWRCLRLKGSPRKLADEIVEAVGIRPNDLEGLHLSLAIPPEMNLGDLRLRTFELYSDSAPADVMITTSRTDAEIIGTLLYATRSTIARR
jgi:hypothetical protein